MDRFSGTVLLGGKITEEQLADCETILEDIDSDLDTDGLAYFQECTQDDFLSLVEYCKAHGIALAIQWDAKWEYNAQVEYWIDGKYKKFPTDSNGNIVVRVCDLGKHRTSMTMYEYIMSLDIPELPEFSIVEPCEYCGGRCTDDDGCDAYISDGESAAPTDEQHNKAST